MQATSAREFVPQTHSLRAMREAASRCQGCDLYRHATQTVFGVGPAHARVMLVGETPGDREDIEGRPFVGAAGRLLDESLEAVGIDRETVYVTNAVKHFKWTPRGKRRLHAKPSAREITACRPWLDGEISIVAPRLIVCMGATAAQALLGRQFRITKERGKLLPQSDGKEILATYHPSAVLRAPDEDARRRMRREFVSDLKVASDWLKRE
jgi:uracil-DNA glycosylase